MANGLWGRLFSRSDGRDAVRPLYAAIIAEARQPHWYRDGGVADTVDGRFEMVAAIMSAVAYRMEALGEEAEGPLVLTTECFIEDMEGQLREQGVGDVSVGKHVGTMMSALGGRMGAYREGLLGEGLDVALVRNLYRGDGPGSDALAHTQQAYQDLADRLKSRSLSDLLAAQL
jgi:cytochrome b pre-mRNA-processing protein 3